MRNPIRSEADAFRFVLLTIGYFALIVIGSVINVWLGVAVFVVLTAGVLWWFLMRRTDAEAPVRQAPAPHAPEHYRVLVVANETVGGAQLLETIRERIAGRDARVLVVCPALNSPLRHWASDEDDARNKAQERLDASLKSMQGAGIQAVGGDRRRRSDPGDRGRAPHLPAGRTDRVDASAGEVALARTRRRRQGARALRAAGHPRRRRSPLTEIEQLDPLPLRADLRDVHRAALGAGALSDEWARERLPRHTERDGFVFLAARFDGCSWGSATATRARSASGGPTTSRRRSRRRARTVARPAAFRDRRAPRAAGVPALRDRLAAARAAALAAAARPGASLDAAQLPQGARVLREERVAGACRGRLRVGYPPYLVLGKRLVSVRCYFPALRPRRTQRPQRSPRDSAAP